MSDVYLIRHGNTFESGSTAVYVGAKTDLALTDSGHEQAQNMASFLRSHHKDSIQVYSGPLQRQRQSAQALTDDFQIEDAFDEIDYGPWEGLSIEQIKVKWPHAYEAWSSHAAWPEAIFAQDEAFYVDKLLAWFLQSDRFSGCVAVYTSQGLIRLCLKVLAQISDVIDLPDNFTDFKVKTGHFCHLGFDKGFSIKSWNTKP